MADTPDTTSEETEAEVEVEVEVEVRTPDTIKAEIAAIDEELSSMRSAAQTDPVKAIEYKAKATERNVLAGEYNDAIAALTEARTFELVELAELPADEEEEPTVEVEAPTAEEAPEVEAETAPEETASDEVVAEAIVEAPVADPVEITTPTENLETPMATDSTQPEPAVAEPVAAAIDSQTASDASTDSGPSTATEERTPAPVVAALSTMASRIGDQVTFDQLASSMHAALSSRGREDVVKIQLFGEDDLAIGPQHGTRRNAELLGQLPMDLMAVTAAMCDPPEIRRDIPNCVRVDRPVADTLTRVPMERGHLQVPRPVGLVDLAIDWDYETDQDAVDVAVPATWKQCGAGPTCPTFDKFVLQAIAFCYEVGRDIDLSAPESAASYLKSVMGGMARHADGALLAQLAARATADGFAYTYAGALSSVPDIYSAAVEILTSIETAGRISLGNYSAIVQQGFDRWNSQDTWRRDQPAPDMTATAALQAAGVGSVTETPDWATGGANSFPAIAAGAITVPQAAKTFDIYLYDPSGVRLGTGRELTLGTNSEFRSWDQHRRNTRGIFAEIEETLIFTGCLPTIHLAITTCPSGARVGQVTPATVCV